jgi:hypothetical protein
LTNIVTPIAGWTAVTNATAGTIGADADTDTQLRLLRQQEISQSGSCAQDAMRARILEISGVLSAKVYTNDSDAAISTTTSNTTTTSLTRPPHSFEAVLWDGPSFAASTTVILQTIWDNKPTGGVSVGTSSGTVTDALGATQTVYYSRAVAKRLFITVVLVKGVDYVGDAAVASALSSYVTNSQIDPGTPLIARKLSAVITDLEGVEDITSLLFDFTSPALNAANLVTAYDVVATLATSDVSVSS